MKLWENVYININPVDTYTQHGYNLFIIKSFADNFLACRMTVTVVKYKYLWNQADHMAEDDCYVVLTCFR